MREIRSSGAVRGVRRKPYPYRDIVHPLRSSAQSNGIPDVKQAWQQKRHTMSRQMQQRYFAFINDY